LPYLACTSLVAINISMDTFEDVLNIHDPSIPLAFLEEPKGSEECEGNDSVDDHDHNRDEWYGYNVDEE